MPSIYLAGGYIKDSVKIHTYPTIWKDTTMTFLDMNLQGYCHSLFVLNNNIYAAGACTQDGIPFYWKNNSQIVLGNNKGVVNDVKANELIVCAGGHLYINSFPESYNIPVYWVNGVLHNVSFSVDTGNFKEIVEINTVALWGNDVFTGGFISDTVYHTASGNTWYVEYKLPVIWKNGQAIFYGKQYGAIESICFKNNKLYASGYITDSTNQFRYPAYWEDGTMYQLSNFEGDAPHITANDSMFVISGYYQNKPSSQIVAHVQVWKNGVPIPLAAGDQWGMAYASALLNNDIYTVGPDFVLKNGADIGKYHSTDYYFTSIFIQ